MSVEKQLPSRTSRIINQLQAPRLSGPQTHEYNGFQKESWVLIGHTGPDGDSYLLILRKGSNCLIEIRIRTKADEEKGLDYVCLGIDLATPLDIALFERFEEKKLKEMEKLEPSLV